MKTSQHEDLLRYYKDELTYLRRMGGEFAALYPRVAARLELGHQLEGHFFLRFGNGPSNAQPTL